MVMTSYIVTSTFDISLPKNIVELFTHINYIIDINNNTISFRGKAYNNIIYMLSKSQYSLYQDLSSSDLANISATLNEYIEIYGTIIKYIYNGDWNHELLLEQWFDNMFDIYHPTYDELCSLREVFQICAKNNLYLYASYT